MTALLQDNKLEQANALRNEVFEKYNPDDYQLYVRTLSSLINADQAKDGDRLLKYAMQNLNAEDDAEGFYRLGRVFEQKCEQSSQNPADHAMWVNSAAQAFRRATELYTGQSFLKSKFYISLAGALDQQGKLQEMTQTLEAASAINKFDTLAPYLVKQLSLSKSTVAGVIPHCPFHLDRVQFKIGNLNCNCQVSKVEDAMNKIDGVAFAMIPTQSKPYLGSLVIDQSKTKAQDAFNQTAERIRTLYATAKTPISPEIEMLSVEPVSSAEAAIELEQTLLNGSATTFFNAFKAVVPFEPTRELAQQQAKSAL
jgi:hypothetical protein